jgi:hypothetical protein
MNLDADSFFAFWEAGPIEQHEVTDKLSYRVIGGYKFSFKKVDYEQRTELLIDVLLVCQNILPLIERIAAAEEESSDTDLALSMLPDIVATVANPQLLPIIRKLCGLASVDRGAGTFESLNDNSVAEDIFGKALTLQLPVAVTAAWVNLHSVFPKFGK